MQMSGEDKVALSVSAYGDYDEETSGQRTINAERFFRSS